MFQTTNQIYTYTAMGYIYNIIMIVDGYYDIIFRTRNVWSLITELWLGVSLFSDTTVRSCQIQTILKPSIEYKLFSQSVLKHAYWTICVSNYNIYMYMYMYMYICIYYITIYIYVCGLQFKKNNVCTPHIMKIWRRRYYLCFRLTNPRHPQQ